MEKLGFGLIILGLFLATYFTLGANFVHFDTEYSTAVLSEYGGFIGGTIGSLFSLAGYLLIYEGLRTSKLTAFENTYFNLISAFNEFRTLHIGLTVKTDDGTTEYRKGQDFFEYLFHNILNPKKIDWEHIPFEHVKKSLSIHESQLTQYYGMFNMILKKVESSNLRTHEKDYYLEYLLNILNDQELFLFFNKHILFTNKFDQILPWCNQFANTFKGRKYQTEES